MLRKPLLSLVLAILLGVGFAYGLTRLFVLRYAVGDIYPPYSSLRADPLGTKALADALDDLPNVEVRRNFKPLPKVRPPGPVTLVYTGVPHRAYWTEPELAAFDTLVVGGSRAVFAFYPVERKPSEMQDQRSSEEEWTKKEEKTDEERPRRKKRPDKKKAGDDKKAAKDRKEVLEDKNFIGFDTVAKRWGFTFNYLAEEKKAFDRHAAVVEPGGHLESDVSWHSALYFGDLKPQWKVLYVCGTQPVVIERQYGAGSIVLIADAYHISNEALRMERHPRLLARLFFRSASRDLRRGKPRAARQSRHRLTGAQIPPARRHGGTASPGGALRVEKCGPLHPSLRATTRRER